MSYCNCISLQGIGGCGGKSDGCPIGRSPQDCLTDQWLDKAQKKEFKSDSCFYIAVLTLDTVSTHQYLKGLWHLSSNQHTTLYDVNHKG